ncbi:hypothetical protein [Catellatospora chokoriensis]|uniref:hypothetical protein n=1 Tax=Catellatospora chokoriensis TaxID=310353 RepID=UPI0017807F39|nr:hypothetical protein [Catellatospora chokoriensis]
MALTALSSWFLAQATIQDLGVVRFFAEVSVMLLLPAIGGVAAATACHNEAGLPLPDPARARVARFLWAIGWTAAATAAAEVGQLADAPTDPAATVRNMLIYTGIALLAVSSGFSHMAWLPVLGYTVVCMMFGFPPNEPRYYWWAPVMEADATLEQLAAAGSWYGLALAGYVFRGGSARIGPVGGGLPAHIRSAP